MRQETTEVIEAKLNVPVSPEETSFGAIPVGAMVQDERLGKPLVYTQGKKQYTDAELFDASKNPEKLVLAELAEKRGKEQTRSISSLLMYALPIGAVALLLSFIFARKMSRKGRSQG